MACLNCDISIGVFQVARADTIVEWMQVEFKSNVKPLQVYHFSN